MSGKNLRSDEVLLVGELVSAVEGSGFDAVEAVTPDLFVAPVAGSNSGQISSSDSGLSPGFPIIVPVESHVVGLRVYRPSIFSAPAPAAGLSGHWMLVRGSKYLQDLDPRGLVVESTARNCAKRLRRRVADSKYGFECCCGQQRALKWQGWRPDVKGTSRGLGKTQRSSAPILLPYHPKTSSKERYAGLPPRNH
jgi:hypothetical protein